MPFLRIKQLLKAANRLRISTMMIIPRVGKRMLRIVRTCCIIVRIRTYGGKEYNTLNVTINDAPLMDFVTTTGSTMTEYAWANDQTLTGRAMIVFSTNYGSKQGIGVESVRIVAQGTRVIYSDYLTSCSVETSIEDQELRIIPHKFLKNGQLYIRAGEHIYSITGQRVE